MKKLRNHLFLIAMMLFNFGLAQSGFFSGIVRSEDDMPVPYASVGMLDEPIGTVSDVHGVFAIDLKDMVTSDSIKISAFGYQSQKYRVLDVVDQPNFLVHLQTNLYKLRK